MKQGLGFVLAALMALSVAACAMAPTRTPGADAAKDRAMTGQTE